MSKNYTVSQYTNVNESNNTDWKLQVGGWLGEDWL